jgi:hypothetical protein
VEPERQSEPAPEQPPASRWAPPAPESAEQSGSDVVNDAMIPTLLVLAMWLFGGYVLSVREALYAGGNDLLQYVYFFFVIATVLIAKIRSVKGDEAKGGAYMIALAGAMLLFILRFSSEAGGVFGSLGGMVALAMNCFAFALAGVGIDWISRDCTVDPASEETATGSWFDPVPRDKRRPGRAVVVFSLLAACVFGAGQFALARSYSEVYQRGFLFAAGYAVCAMLLLALTNLSGIRLYFASRAVRTPMTMIPYWVAASVFLATLALGLAWILPRTGGHAGQSIFASVPNGPANGPHSTKFRYAPASGLNTPEGEVRGRRSGEQGNQGEGQSPGGSGTNSMEGKGDKTAPSDSGAKTTPGSGQEEGAGEQKLGRGESGKEQPGEDGKQGDSTQTRPDQRPPDQLREDLAPPTNLGWLGRILMWLLIAIVAALLLYQLARFVAKLFGMRLKLPAIVLPRFGGRRSRPRELQNPFASKRALERMSPREVVLHTYGAFMALANACGAPRAPQATASEFLRGLPTALAGLRQEAEELSELYLRAEYSPEGDFAPSLPRLKEIWGRMEEFLAAWQRPAEHPRAARGNGPA